jgi:hypothetical protein
MPVPHRTQSLIPSNSKAITPPAAVSATQLLAGVAMFVSVPVFPPVDKSVNVVVPFPAVSRDGTHAEIGVFPFTAGVHTAVLKLWLLMIT